MSQSSDCRTHVHCPRNLGTFTCSPRQHEPRHTSTQPWAGSGEAAIAPTGKTNSIPPSATSSKKKRPLARNPHCRPLPKKSPPNRQLRHNLNRNRKHKQTPKNPSYRRNRSSRMAAMPTYGRIIPLKISSMIVESQSKTGYETS